MIVILTGDIVSSRRSSSKKWIDDLKKMFQIFGKSPSNWEVYRGDEFQIKFENPTDALVGAIKIKAFLKSIKLDARMSLGFGEVAYKSKKITESNGSAYVKSGELFETLRKQKINLAVNSGDLFFDAEMNLILRLALSFMDKWLQQSAEIVLLSLQNQTLSQEEIGAKLGINQAAVSRRQKRANYDLVKDLDNYYRKRIESIKI